MRRSRSITPHWWSQRRLQGATDNLPLAEFERRWWKEAETQVA